ncbi:hypothetical protein EVAR_39503_1 [Eumeta japonica]|uniref:Uncharacterized protein n=1 Tax=Eumeta variegata TaxID=151549 RepID=A0A4C1W1R2_EUMVA|nr:hypothetical protein EVAR_39503_1 [Eumeta japonica]
MSRVRIGHACRYAGVHFEKSGILVMLRMLTGHSYGDLAFGPVTASTAGRAGARPPGQAIDQRRSSAIAARYAARLHALCSLKGEYSKRPSSQIINSTDRLLIGSAGRAARRARRHPGIEFNLRVAGITPAHTSEMDAHCAYRDLRRAPARPTCAPPASARSSSANE